MASVAHSPVVERTSNDYRYLIAIALHTLVVYALALELAPLLARRWFAWLWPNVFHRSGIPYDWYFPHLNFLAVVLAAVCGYLTWDRFLPVIVGGQIRNEGDGHSGTYAWAIPALVLMVKMLQYQAHRPLIREASLPTIKYFFEVQQPVPEIFTHMAGIPSTDPHRTLAQVLVTAPFYAGVAYSAGAVAAKYHVMRRIMRPDQPDAPLLPDGILGASTPELPSSSRD